MDKKKMVCVNGLMIYKLIFIIMKKTLVKWLAPHWAPGIMLQRHLSEGISSSDSLALNLQASVAGEIISRTTTQQDAGTYNVCAR